MYERRTALAIAGLTALALACQVGGGHPESDASALGKQASGVFGTLPTEVVDASNPLSREKTDLGRMLYYEARLSRGQDISCNSCHLLDRFGVDGEATSPGHRGQRGDRNSPTVYNAGLQLAQFWDGRAANLEEQAKGPVLNPIEMAMRSEADTVAVLASIPDYPEHFRKAFPDDPDPLSYDNMARAIGAFERRLMTPGPFDAFQAGDASALTGQQTRGLAAFMQTGCVTCHMGPGVGGTLYRKLGLVKPYPAEDLGRFKVTGKEEDRYVFKVPSLRNVAETGPWFHDGSIDSLDRAIRSMAEHQLGVTLDDAQVADIESFLESLTGTPDAEYIARPVLPESGPDTPAPDPS